MKKTYIKPRTLAKEFYSNSSILQSSVEFGTGYAEQSGDGSISVDANGRSGNDWDDDEDLW